MKSLYWLIGMLLLGVVCSQSSTTVSSSTPISPNSTYGTTNATTTVSIQTTSLGTTKKNLSSTTSPKGLSSPTTSSQTGSSPTKLPSPTTTPSPSLPSKTTSPPILSPSTQLSNGTNDTTTASPVAPSNSTEHNYTSTTVATASSSTPGSPTTTNIINSSDMSSAAQSTESSTPTAETSSSTVQSAAASSEAPTSTEALPTTTSPVEDILINEFTFTGLFAAGSDFFIELKRQSKTEEAVNGLTVVLLDGAEGLECQMVKKLNSNWTKDGLAVENVNLATIKKDLQSIVVVLYMADLWTTCEDYKVNTTSVLKDVMVVGKTPEVDADRLKENFNIIGQFNVLVADESKMKLHKGTYSVSRCDEKSAMDIGSYIIAMTTKEMPNNCTMPEQSRLKMSFKASPGMDCDDLNKTSFIKNYIATKVGDKCGCGLSPYLISASGMPDCKHMTLTWLIQSINSDQKRLINSSYSSVLKDGTCLGNGSLCLTKPCRSCSSHLPAKGKGGSITVTIAVVITCIIVFLIIVGVVIIYIRKKRRGILQFRMTRLNDDDDDLIGQDTDDFVGSQDASFSNSSYSRFK